jgi:hypothetical protein
VQGDELFCTNTIGSAESPVSNTTRRRRKRVMNGYSSIQMMPQITTWYEYSPNEYYEVVNTAETKSAFSILSVADVVVKMVCLLKAKRIPPDLTLSTCYGVSNIDKYGCVCQE